MNDCVAILLCTYNDKFFLKKQLLSYTEQTYPHWKLFASNDGDNEETKENLKHFYHALGETKVSLRIGPKKGFVTNFLSLACDLNIQSHFYAFSDQDDIWEKDKLARAVQWLKTQPQNIPALYCSRTLLMDTTDKIIGPSPYFKRPASFSHALVQNIACGNTMVFNHAARDLLIKAGVVDVPAHDWWLYLLVTGASGNIFYDEHPTVRYRQHPDNIIGFRPGIFSRAVSIYRLLKGRFKKFNEMHIQALAKIEPYLTKENQKKLSYFKNARNARLLDRIRYILRTQVYRQTWVGNCGLVVATLLKKI